MIRRKAALVGTGDQGFVLAWLKKKDANEVEKIVFAFEAIGPLKAGDNPGMCSEQPLENIRFLDGSPEVIAEIE